MKKTFKRILCGILCLACIPVSGIMFSSCSDKVQEIHNVEQFMQVVETFEASGNYGDLDRKLGTAKLMADLDFSGVDYSPKHLKVNFDGNGYSLNNITINEYEEAQDGAGIGIFSRNDCSDGYCTYFAKIFNLTVNNLIIKYTGRDTPVGGLVGVETGDWELCEEDEATFFVDYDNKPAKNLTMIDNVTINGKIEASQTQYVGGLVGCGYRGIIQNCTAGVEIIGGKSTGGLLGGCEFDKESLQIEIENCKNSGSIISNSANAGGICGSRAKISNCVNTGDVTGEINVGGIVGYTQYSIKDCTNEGKVEGTAYGEHEYADIGGIAGCAECYTWDTYTGHHSNEAMITNCTNKGDVISAYDRIGGIAGYSSQDVSGCSNEATVQGRNVVGGIIGWWYSKGSVSKCKNSGDIAGVLDVGGLVGGISTKETVQFMNSHNSGKITASNRAGGLVGGSFAIIDEDLLPTCGNTGEIICEGVKDEIYNKLNS